jgi:hypothetical protein
VRLRRQLCGLAPVLLRALSLDDLRARPLTFIWYHTIVPDRFVNLVTLLH